MTPTYKQDIKTLHGISDRMFRRAAKVAKMEVLAAADEACVDMLNIGPGAAEELFSCAKGLLLVSRYASQHVVEFAVEQVEK